MHMVTMLSVLAPAVAAAAAAAASGGFCHITVQDQLQWLSCPLAGIERGLTIGVNHVGNCGTRCCQERTAAFLTVFTTLVRHVSRMGIAP